MYGTLFILFNLLLLINGLCGKGEQNLIYQVIVYTKLLCRRQHIGSVLLKMQECYFLEVCRFYSHFS